MKLEGSSLFLIFNSEISAKLIDSKNVIPTRKFVHIMRAGRAENIVERKITEFLPIAEYSIIKSNQNGNREN